MSPLRATRIAAAAMLDLTKHLGLGNLAKRFDGDDIDQWLVVDSSEVRVVDGGRAIAHCYIRKEQVSIVVQDAYQLVRNSHLSEFSPREYGIHINGIPDWKGETQPDLVATVPITQMPEYDAPRRPMPPYTTHRKPRYNGSL